MNPGAEHADDAAQPLRSDADRNRARIVAAARRVFGRGGLNASMASVAREAGVGIAALFRRFPTKEDLIAAVFADRMDAHVGAITAALPASHTPTRRTRRDRARDQGRPACQSCGARLDRDLNAALNLAALAAQVTSTESSRRDAKQPAGNPRKTTTGGAGYRRGKTPGPAGSQRHPREAVAR